jgi:chromosome segregation ATPase
VKADAEKLFADMQGIASKSEQSLQKAEGVRLQLQQVEKDWEGLRQQLKAAQAEAKETRDGLLAKIDGAIAAFGKKCADAEDRLKSANKASMTEQADLLRKLDASTRGNVDSVNKAHAEVKARSDRVDELLTTLRTDLQSEVHTRLTKAEQLLESEVQRIERYLEEEQRSLRDSSKDKAADLERTLREEMSAFKSEMKRSLAEHEEGVDRRLTDFLNKQNALVQNLAQQIDSYNRVSVTQASGLELVGKNLEEISKGVRAERDKTAGDIGELSAALGELKALLSDAHGHLHSQSELIGSLDSSLQDTTMRLNQTLETLKHLPLVGGKFK